MSENSNRHISPAPASARAEYRVLVEPTATATSDNLRKLTLSSFHNNLLFFWCVYAPFNPLTTTCLNANSHAQWIGAPPSLTSASGPYLSLSPPEPSLSSTGFWNLSRPLYNQHSPSPHNIPISVVISPYTSPRSLTCVVFAILFNTGLIPFTFSTTAEVRYRTSGSHEGSRRWDPLRMTKLEWSSSP